MESAIVTTVELKKFTSIGQNVDCELLIPHLLIAQQLYVEPVLGKCLYEDLILNYDNNTISGDTQTLYEQYIVPAVAYASWYSLAPFLHIRTNRNGLNKSGTDSVSPVEIDEFSMYLSKVENLMRFYLKRLEEYLICNKTLFPLYCQNTSEISSGGSIFTGFNTHPKGGRFYSQEGSDISSLLGITGSCGCSDCPSC